MDAINSSLCIAITNFKSCIILIQVYKNKKRTTQKQAGLYNPIFQAN